MKIAIAILATNAYSVLGIRFIKRFMQFYQGEAEVIFYFFSDINPEPYLPAKIKVVWHYTTNKSWVDGTNLKFKSIMRLSEDDVDYIFYFDADTNVSRPFTADWFLGDSVAGQHFGDQDWMKEEKGYERNPRSKAYVPKDTYLPQVYVYGAFFGGTKKFMITFCEQMVEWQKEDKAWGYEPAVNDESYINCYFHFNPPSKLVLSKDFAFDISDKAGIGETRNVNLNVTHIKEMLLLNKEKNINISQGKVIVL